LGIKRANKRSIEGGKGRILGRSRTDITLNTVRRNLLQRKKEETVEVGLKALKKGRRVTFRNKTET